MSLVPHAIRGRVPQDPRWHIFSLLSGLAFALMLMVARLSPQYLNVFDEWFEMRIAPLQTFPFIEPFLVVTVLGSVVGVITVAIGAVYLLRHNRFALVQLVLLLVGSALSMRIAKAFVERVRPEVLTWLDPLNTYSFPSGHATLTTAFYGFIAVQLYRRNQSSLARFFSIFVPTLIIILVCMSRIVLNYHYVTDVVAGVLLGLFWLGIVFMLPRPRSASRSFGLGRR